MSKRVGDTGLLAAALVLVAGCIFPGFGNFGNGDEPFPTMLASYSTGSATLEITKGGVVETLVLLRIGRGSHLNSFMGASVTWRNEDGWILLVNSYDATPFLGPRPSGEPDTDAYSGDISVQRIDGPEFWKADGYGMSGNRCIVDLIEASETGLRGSATCRGLRWADGIGDVGMGEPVLIEDQDPFDAEITFEATP